MSINKQTMSDQVYQTLKEQIIKGYYYEGQKLTETGIAKILSVSPTPVREAFKKLESEGFIMSIPYRGVFVKSYTTKEVECAYLMRAKIQGLALRYTMESIDDETMKELDRIFYSCVVNKDENILLRFLPVHNWMIYNANMDMLIEALKSINAIINVDRLMYKIGPLDEELVEERQNKLYQLIKENKTDEAVELLEEMIVYTLKIYLRKNE